MAIFLHDWAGQDSETVFDAFGVSKEVSAGVDIILASYTYEDYSGDAYVLFRKDNELYEVTGSHCSCYGLEDQWRPDKVTLEDIRAGLTRYAPSYYGDELSQWLESQPQ